MDAVVTAGKNGPQVFTLEGADHAYRVLIESMNEGALTLTADKTILYANQCFARMVKCPLEQVIGDATQTLTAILKPSYAPIEQYGESGSLRQGAWTDLYALGVVLFQTGLMKKAQSSATWCLFFSGCLVDIHGNGDGAGSCFFKVV